MVGVFAEQEIELGDRDGERHDGQPVLSLSKYPKTTRAGTITASGVRAGHYSALAESSRMAAAVASP